MSSEEVGDIFRGGKAYDVQVWSTPSTRNSPTDIAQPADRHADRRPRAPRRRRHRADRVRPRTSSTQDTVAADRRRRQRGATAASAVGRRRPRPARGARASRSATTPSCWARRREREARTDRLLIFGIAAADRDLPAPAGRLRRACAWRSLFFLTLPMALVGGVLAWPSTGGTLSLGSLVGFLAVLGIAARNGILLISHCQHLEHHEGEPFGPALVLRGAQERLSPILMTALATGLALVPLRRRGHDPRARDRAPDGGRHPRRPGHLDAAQPVHRARRCTCASAKPRSARRQTA